MHISNKCSIAVHCLIFINEYGEENKVTSELLSLSTGCNPVTIRNIISAMKKDGIIDVKFGTGGATLAVPMQDISLYRICEAVDPKAIDKMISVHSSPSPFCPVGRNIGDVLDRTYDTLKENLISSMKSITMEKIVNDYHTILEHDK
ncbi:Rrf2 family transcriptional regulator [Pseudoflavonifractor phocaeensis]|uniref:Rrf2 family transcriptional regulator n=1 Tax=Pseudoflavonifractor phocaeensis TaxID=1870988 RepID=UPI001F310DA7|nr:Rrf2 family transcriptional regulator [Pseudoflavonifractor phocaeensis]MCF2661822.1 Rrf2 family transcriptional regulator [Pseudoflavonifractor phocaeensis]